MGNGFYDLPTVGIVEPTHLNFTIKVVRDNPKQFSKAHADDAGFDIIASEHIDIQPGQSALVPTNLFIKLPDNHVGILKSRSGLAVKHGLDVAAGVIDAGYTGEIKVLIRNSYDTPYKISPGDKIAQMLVMPISVCSISDVEALNEKTTRGSGGFNSTGY